MKKRKRRNKRKNKNIDYREVRLNLLKSMIDGNHTIDDLMKSTKHEREIINHALRKLYKDGLITKKPMIRFLEKPDMRKKLYDVVDNSMQLDTIQV